MILSKQRCERCEKLMAEMHEYDNYWDALVKIVKIYSRYDYGDDFGGFLGGGFPSIFGAPRVRVLVVPVDEVFIQFLSSTCLIVYGDENFLSSTCLW